jgi:Dihydrofolate reductase
MQPISLSIIVAASENMVIGKNGQLPWHLPADLAYFKEKTMGHPIIMGRRTFQSIGKPLPGRINIVLSTDRTFFHSELKICHSYFSVLEYCRQMNFSNVFIIGGEHVYRSFLPIADMLYITRVHTLIDDGTAHFPNPDLRQWEKSTSTFRPKDDKNAFDLTYETYIRRKKLTE